MGKYQIIVTGIVSLVTVSALTFFLAVKPPAEGWYSSESATIMDGESKGYFHFYNNEVWLVNVNQVYSNVYGFTVGKFSIQKDGTLHVYFNNSFIKCKPRWLRMHWTSIESYTNGILDKNTPRVFCPIPKDARLNYTETNNEKIVQSAK